METSTMSAPVRAADAIRNLIVDQGFGPEATLPSDRELSRRLGFSYMTIRAANGFLASEGIVRRERGRGTFVVTPPREDQIGTSGRRQKLIGYVYVSRGESEDYALRQFGIMERLLKAKGHPMVLGILHEEDFGRTLPSSFDTLKLDALIIDGFLSQGYLHQLVQLGKPLVVAGNHSAHDQVPCVKIDFFEFSRLMTQALFDHGMEAVCMITEPFQLDGTQELLAGYRQALLERKDGVEIVGAWERNDIARMTESLRRVFAQFGPKLGLLANNHDEVGFALNSLATGGVDMTQCLAVIGSDHRTPINVPHIVSEVPVDRLAMEAAESLGKLLNGEPVQDQVLRPLLQSFGVRKCANFEWKLCGMQEEGRGGRGSTKASRHEPFFVEENKKTTSEDANLDLLASVGCQSAAGGNGG